MLYNIIYRMFLYINRLCYKINHNFLISYTLYSFLNAGNKKIRSNPIKETSESITRKTGDMKNLCLCSVLFIS